MSMSVTRVPMILAFPIPYLFRRHLLAHTSKLNDH